VNKERLKALIYNSPFGEYRNYPFLKKTQKKQAFYQKMLSCLKKDGHLVEISYEDIEGIVIVQRLPWDSAFFDLAMGAIVGIFPAQSDERLIVSLIDEALAWFKSVGVKHISFKVDSADIKTIFLLQKKGFYLVDSLSTYLYAKGYTQIIKSIRPLFNLRACEKEDIEPLMEIVEYAFKDYPNRFKNDPFLSNEGMVELYKGWVKNLIAEGYLIVAERKGKVVGFLGYFPLAELNKITAKLHVGNALSATGPGGEGCYAQFITLAGEAPFYPTTVEATTSLTNTIVQNMWIKIVSTKVIRNQYVFHYYFK
jgi:hypothetical protein